ncbi:MAG TPA: helix-turn-helix transcriptional regulator [Usitatibacter sp.]|jgi:AraC-like DNA-binding protein|nr:helix-turn-helix transcriptional regulator [Usitatibacter sp.]
MAGFDLLLRAATVALALSAAISIAWRPRRSRVAMYAAFAVAGIAAFMIASAPGIHSTLGLAAFFINAWCLATPGVIWLLARALFGDSDGHEPWHVAAIGVLVAVTLAGDYGRFQLGPLAQEPRLAQALLLAGRAGACGLLFTACVMAIRHWRGDLVEERRRVRSLFVVVVGSAFVALAGSELVLRGASASMPWVVAGHVLLFMLAAALAQGLARGGLPELFTQPLLPSAAALTLVRGDGVDAALASRVTERMAKAKLWRTEGLGIAELAREMGTHEHRLRRAINRHLGYRNFNDFLHDYRLNEAASRLAEPAQAHLPVLTIALDCGYGSIGPFNRAFKARYGITPGHFRNQRALARDSASRAAGP